jgi:hypothetical protein
MRDTTVRMNMVVLSFLEHWSNHCWNNLYPSFWIIVYTSLRLTLSSVSHETHTCTLARVTSRCDVPWFVACVSPDSYQRVCRLPSVMMSSTSLCNEFTGVDTFPFVLLVWLPFFGETLLVWRKGNFSVNIPCTDNSGTDCFLFLVELRHRQDESTWYVSRHLCNRCIKHDVSTDPFYVWANSVSMILSSPETRYVNKVCLFATAYKKAKTEGKKCHGKNYNEYDNW